MTDFPGHFGLLKFHLVLKSGGSLGIIGVKSLFPVSPSFASRPTLSHVATRCHIFTTSKAAY